MIRARFLALLAVFVLALTAAPGAASAAGGGGTIPPEALSALLGGTPEAKWITYGVYSPDGSRIAYSVLDQTATKPFGEEPWTDPVFRSDYNETWTVRADGTQATRLLRAGYYSNAYSRPSWDADGMVRVGHRSYTGDLLEVHFGVAVGAGDVDAWRSLRPGEWGNLTPDGRFRVVFFGDAIDDDNAGGVSRAYEVATGKQYAIMTHDPYTRAPRWRNDCGDPTRNPEQTLLGAVSGPNPACRFARAAGDGNAPGDGDWLTGAAVSTLLGGTPAADKITAARWSPDRSRILFRVEVYGAWDISPEDPDDGDFWSVRADGSQLRRLSSGGDTQTPLVSQARWVDNGTVELAFHYGWDLVTVTDGVVDDAGTDCWTTTAAVSDDDVALGLLESAYRLPAAACPPPKPIDEKPATKADESKPADPAPTTPAQQTQTQSIKPVVITPTLPGLSPAKVLAVGKQLGGKKNNLLTVKFTAPAGYGARVTLALRDGGRVLATTDLTIEQAKSGLVRLKLSAKSRKLLSKSKGRVTVRVVPLSDG